MKRVLIAGFVLWCLAAAPAGAQTTPELAAQMQERLDAPADMTLAPVENLTCEQMSAEMIVAGQRMSGQLDPNFAADVQEMQDVAGERQREAMAGAMGAGAVCAIPGLGMACTAAMQANMARQMSHVDEDQARRDAVVGQVYNSMDGIDMQRMQAINTRFEDQRCQMPEAPPAQ